MYSQIKSAIKTKLEAINGIKSVYGYEKGNLNGFPSAIITLAEIEATQDGTCQDLRRYSFRVSIYQEIAEDALGAENAEERLEALIDTVISAFEDDYTLGGVVQNMNVKAEAGYADRGNPMRVFEMTLDTYVLYELS